MRSALPWLDLPYLFIETKDGLFLASERKKWPLGQAHHDLIGS